MPPKFKRHMRDQDVLAASEVERVSNFVCLFVCLFVGLHLQELHCGVVCKFVAYIVGIFLACGAKPTIHNLYMC